MTPIPENEATLRWHDPEALKTQGGEAEAKAVLRKLTTAESGRVQIIYDQSGNFPTNAGAAEVIDHLDRCDRGWATASPFHVEVDPATAACPPLS